MSATIALLGDIMLGRGVADALTRTPPADLWAPELRELIAGCDVVVGNLECCASDRGEPTLRVPGKPFYFRAPPVAVESLRSIGLDVAGLANNHALDYEVAALADTIAHLHAAGIATAGAGPNEGAARAAAAVQHPALRVAVVAVSDHPREFAAAGADTWGIAWAPLSRGVPDWLSDELQRARAQFDAVIAFPHWGPNMTTRPAPWQREVAAELLAAGAHIVAGHSAHVFHGVERLPAGLVLYDLGDALDDYAVDDRLRNDLGLLALWRPAGTPELELIGLRGDFCHTRLATGEDAEWVARRLELACAELGGEVRRTGEARFVVTG
ncbi:MAG: hypothetical protein QOD76_1286 [Solirubrobacteraceae bacterium]|nr:hypothetical protein [Solirubrobacteraceae bacterium]